MQFTARDGSIRKVPAQRRSVPGVSNAEINRELTTLKRMFNLALQAGKLIQKPYTPMLRENNVRTGFFDHNDFEAVVRHVPREVRPVIAFAYITGWRIDSEVLPLQWKHVDFSTGEVRLDPGTTKNGEGRTFPMTAELRRLLTAEGCGGRCAAQAESGCVAPVPPRRQTGPIVSRGLPHRLPPGRLSGARPARLPSHGGPESGSGRHPRTCGYAAHGSQDPQRF